MRVALREVAAADEIRYNVTALGKAHKVRRFDSAEVSTMKAVLVCGGEGFIGSHLVKRLKREGC
jgi:FlaA1/EpsC-like NDP-sugar epimerase